MTAEFQLTSSFTVLANQAIEMDNVQQFPSLGLIKPSVSRVVWLRGRLPSGQGDLKDIYYDHQSFSVQQVSPETFKETIRQLAWLEGRFYPMAENIGVKAAIHSGNYERIPDFIDAAKDVVAREIGVKRGTLSLALDRGIERFCSANKDRSCPTRSAREMIDNLLDENIVMKSPTGKNVQATNPRLNLLNLNLDHLKMSAKEKEILELARLHTGNTFTYSSEQIAKMVKMSKPAICRIIKKPTAKTH